MIYALITGANRGIGKAIAIELAKKKNNILLVGRNEKELEAVAKEIAGTYKVEANYFIVDLSTINASEKIADWCSQNKFAINILVNNAGYGLSGQTTSHSFEEYQNMMQINMATPLGLILQFIPFLKQHNKAYILNIASAAAYQAVPGLSVYAGTKSFLFSLSRGLRYELRNTNISVTVVNPGATDTNFAIRANVTSEKAIKAANKFNMTPESVAKMAVEGMYAEKAEVITGFVNKVAAFGAWLLPKLFVEKQAGTIYDV